MLVHGIISLQVRALLAKIEHPPPQCTKTQRFQITTYACQRRNATSTDDQPSPLRSQTPQRTSYTHHQAACKTAARAAINNARRDDSCRRVTSLRSRATVTPRHAPSRVTVAAAARGHVNARRWVSCTYGKQLVSREFAPSLPRWDKCPAPCAVHTTRTCACLFDISAARLVAAALGFVWLLPWRCAFGYLAPHTPRFSFTFVVELLS